MRDLTTGSPLKKILLFCWPLLLGNLFQQFYNLADSVIVGKYLGVNAFASVGSTGSLNFLIIGFATGSCAGCAIPVAQHFGAGSVKEVRAYTGQLIYVGVGITLLITTLTYFITGPLLRLLGTPAEIYENAFKYIFIIFMGTGAIVLYNMAGSVLRALGDSRTPLVFLIVATLLNIVLDILFIASFGMGVEGAAYATVIAQLVSGTGCLIYIIRRVPMLHLQRQDLKWDPIRLKKELGIGLPMGLQFSITAVGSIILQAAINSLGAAIVAAVTASIKVFNIVMAPLDSLGISMATYCGQNLGARQMKRVHQGIRCSTVIGIVFSALMYLIVFFFGTKIALLFMDASETEILNHVHTYLAISGLFYPVLAVLMVYRNSLQGLGFSNSAMLAGVAELVARTCVAFGLVSALGFTAICIANPTAWSAADLVLLPMYFSKIRRLDRQFAAAR